MSDNEQHNVESWQLTEFALASHQLYLGSKLGLIKILRSDDGILTLITEESGITDYNSPSPVEFLNVDSLLGFVLDIGIRREKRLSAGSGWYWGSALVYPQSQRKVSQDDFDGELFASIGDLINTFYQSGDKRKEIEAISLQQLLDTYNNSRLLYPNYHAESYLNLMRIIEAVAHDAEDRDVKSCQLATHVASLSSKLNSDAYNAIAAIDANKDRLDIAVAVFSEWNATARQKGWPCCEDMTRFNDSDKLTFACFASAYEYRNKFVHRGFPFPRTHTASKEYLGLSRGMSWIRVLRPDGMKNGDLIDIHYVISDEDEARRFKDQYFQLLPTWYFMKCLAREALMRKVEGMQKR